MAIIGDDLIAGIKRRISMPANQVLLSDTDIFALVDAVIRSNIIPIFESSNQDFFVTTKNVALVASTSEYDIPVRAVARTLRDLKIKDSATDENYVRNVTKVSIEDIEYTDRNTAVSAFYFKGDRIRVLPSVSSAVQTEVLEFWYKIAVSKLITTSAACTVVSVAGTTVTVDAVPSNITALTPIDFIQGLSGNRLYDTDKTPTAVSATSLTFAADTIPSALQAGDYIALAGYSPVITMIPDEAEPLIESLTAKRCLKAIGDFEGARELNEDISEEKKELLKLIEPRIDGEAIIIVNRDGLVRGNRSAQRRWFYGA